MSWIMKRLHLIFVALVLCGDTNGFPVWTRTPVADWQAGLSNTPWNQNDQLSTKVQASQHEPSLVHSSDASVPYAQHQGGPTVQQQDMLASGPSRFYRFESLDPVTKGSLSRYQSAVNTNLSYGSHPPSSSGPSMANPGTAGQVAVAQSSGTNYIKPTSGRYPIFQGQMSTALPQVSGFQTPLYQPSTTAHVSEGQAVSSSREQTSGASTLYEGLTSGIRQTTPSSSQSAVPTGQLSEFQVAAYRPTTATQVSPGQSVSSSRAQTSKASALYEGMGLTIPYSSQSAVSTGQVFEFQAIAYQPSSVPPVFAGQPAVAHTQSLQDSYPSQISGRYIDFQGLSRPSSSQVPVFQTQPTSATQDSTGQSASISMGQSSVASTLNQGLISGRYLTALSQTVPTASQSAVPTGRVSEFQTSYQPIYTPQVLTGQSAFPLLQSSDASKLQASSWYNSQQHGVPSSIQSVGTNQMYGSQALSAYQPSTPQISTGQSLSASPLSQAPFSSRAESSENAKWFTIMHPQTISASFPSVSTSNWASGFHSQSSNQPSSVSQVLANPSTIADSLQAPGSYTSQTSGRRTLLQGQASPSQLSGFQTQSSHQPSTTTWLSAGLPASTSQAQSPGASMLNRDLPSGKYLTSVVQSSPSATQPADTLNQAYGTRTSSYQPLTSFLPGQFASIAAGQSMGGSQKVLPRINI